MARWDGKEDVREASLDPQDWDALRQLGHQMVDDMLTHLQTVRERPAWQKPSDEMRAFLAQPLPEHPNGDEATYQEFTEHILAYPMGSIHPRFWGWVIGTGTPYAMLADMLAAGMNPNVGGGDHGAIYVELQVLAWCKQMLDYPAESSGLLVSGGSMANLVGLTVARNTRAGYDIRRQGVGAAPRRMVLYASRETHSSNIKAVELLGLGSDALRLLPVDEEYRVDVQALESAIAADRAAGLQPFCVIGHAGTVNTGAFDDLEALADLCRREGLWLHVDGAFGALAHLSPDLRHLPRGMQRADSLAFDLHKWMYLPYEIGVALVRSEDAHRRAFSLTPDYLEHSDRGLHAGTWLSDYGLQLSRGFKALKAWMTIRSQGIGVFRHLIQQNVDQAAYLAALVDESPELERLAPAPLNIVCFRYNNGNLSEQALNTLNRELLIRIHEGGIAVPSYTTLDGRYALRVAITNHRSRREDFDLLVETTLRLGKQIASEL